VTGTSPVRETAHKTAENGKRRSVCVTLSGFREAQAARKAELASRVRSLGGETRDSAEFDSRITHVCAPHGIRTMKTLAAGLAGRWLISPEWIDASFDAGEFLSEANYGRIHNGPGPFEGKRFFLHSSVLEAPAGGVCSKDACYSMLKRLGKGEIVDSKNDADFIVITSRKIANLQELPSHKVREWSELLDLIPFATPEDREKEKEKEEKKEEPLVADAKQHSSDDKSASKRGKENSKRRAVQFTGSGGGADSAKRPRPEDNGSNNSDDDFIKSPKRSAAAATTPTKKSSKS